MGLNYEEQIEEKGNCQSDKGSKIKPFGFRKSLPITKACAWGRKRKTKVQTLINKVVGLSIIKANLWLFKKRIGSQEGLKRE